MLLKTGKPLEVGLKPVELCIFSLKAHKTIHRREKRRERKEKVKEREKGRESPIN